MLRKLFRAETFQGRKLFAEIRYTTYDFGLFILVQFCFEKGHHPVI